MNQTLAGLDTRHISRLADDLSIGAADMSHLAQRETNEAEGEDLEDPIQAVSFLTGHPIIVAGWSCLLNDRVKAPETLTGIHLNGNGSANVLTPRALRIVRSVVSLHRITVTRRSRRLTSHAMNLISVFFESVGGVINIQGRIELKKSFAPPGLG